ncbi:uncharacterized protein LOC106717348 [Papilio machaon]|uniref:uncharacterized protein LOC106717348 n=1 Tax=Papilio machaon TaxID=76193 RepID=UPI001E663A5B|nr:uncharacterized protein LOC106717348 [Papilio machaon]
MNNYFIITCVFALFLKGYSANDSAEGEDNNDALNEKPTEEFPQDDIEKYIEMFEETARQLNKPADEDVTALENTIDIYEEMSEIVQVFIDLNINSNNVYKFLRAKGLDRVIAPNLKILHTPLRRQLLILTKQLIDIAPTTAKAIIPVSILDNLLDIFENDHILSIKAYALDIIHSWLPGNPKMQARVMKLKGLDPFYHQISNLDITVIHTLLDLFNKILDEHIKARETPRTRENAEDLVMYQRIGLIERMSTSHVCDGLLNIFESSLPFIPRTGQIISSMFELVKKIKPFCLNTYKGKSKPIEVFNELYQFVNDKSNDKTFEKYGMNKTDVYAVLEKYVQELKHVVKDEL